MKKFISLFLVLAVALSCLVVLASCNKDNTVSISSYTIAEKEYEVGAKFSTSDISVKAIMSDGSEKTVSKNIIVDEESADLKLNDDNTFSEAGTYVLKVYLIEKREDCEIGSWTIKVL
ncbi:MAG: hypothetical protein K5765_04375 [Clostridia bacterium]|nr:hypothetical protein [Clostridia bacterium]